MSAVSFRPVRLLAVIALALGLVLADVGTGGLSSSRAEAGAALPLSYGDRGANVTWLQKRLHVRPRSGWFGPITRSAVKRWQRAHGRPVSGRVGKKTWRVLHRTAGRSGDARASRSSARAVGLNWRALAQCESGGRRSAVNPAGYYGLYQFDRRTWRSVGGRGYPHRASRTRQTTLAKRLYAQRGSSPWPHCGPRLYR